jgi:hypothetical protein
VAAPDLASCIRTCQPDKGCLVQWDAAAGVCNYAALAYDTSATTAVRLAVKLPPSGWNAASSLRGNASDSPAVKAKTLASGFYARLAIPAANVSAWMAAGVPLDAQRAQTFKWGSTPAWDQVASEEVCSRKCDESVLCFGYFYDTASRSCRCVSVCALWHELFGCLECGARWSAVHQLGA